MKNQIAVEARFLTKCNKKRLNRAFRRTWRNGGRDIGGTGCGGYRKSAPDYRTQTLA